MNRVVVLLAGLLLALGVVSPAQAATRHDPPSAVRHVAATAEGQDAGSLQVSWKAPKHASRDKVEGYTVTYAKASRPSARERVTVPARKRSVVLRGLAVGQRYVVRVAASNRWGRGPWADVTAAPAHHEALYAVDEKAHTLVRFATSGKARATTVLTGVSAASDLEVDPFGNAYVATGGAVTEVPLTGAAHEVGPGTQVETDDAGDVYLGDTTGVTRIGTGGDRSVVATDAAGDNLSVDGAGVVTVATTGYDASLTTYAPGAAPLHRALTATKGGRILGDRRGNVYDNTSSGGGAGFAYWVRLAPGATTAEVKSTRNAEYGATVAADDSFYLAQSGSFCPDISENMGTCTPDRQVSSIARYAPDGHLVSDVPTSGFSTRRYLGLDIAVTSTGTLFAANRGSGETPALVRVSSAGGPASRVATGEYGLLAVG